MATDDKPGVDKARRIWLQVQEARSVLKAALDELMRIETALEMRPEDALTPAPEVLRVADELNQCGGSLAQAANDVLGAGTSGQSNLVERPKRKITLAE